MYHIYFVIFMSFSLFVFMSVDQTTTSHCVCTAVQHILCRHRRFRCACRSDSDMQRQGNRCYNSDRFHCLSALFNQTTASAPFSRRCRCSTVLSCGAGVEEYGRDFALSVRVRDGVRLPADALVKLLAVFGGTFCVLRIVFVCVISCACVFRHQFFFQIVYSSFFVSF